MYKSHSIHSFLYVLHSRRALITRGLTTDKRLVAAAAVADLVGGARRSAVASGEAVTLAPEVLGSRKGAGHAFREVLHVLRATPRRVGHDAAPLEVFREGGAVKLW